MPEQYGVRKPKRNILVVDDERVLQKMIHTMLTRQGYSVLTAANGMAALDAAMRRQVDLVVLDLMMPVMDGYETLTMLKKLQHTRHLPVIVLTANATVSAFRRVIQMGADDFIPKPFRRLDLLRKVAYLVRGIRSSTAVKPLQIGEAGPLADTFSQTYEPYVAIESRLSNMLLPVAKGDRAALKPMLIAFEQECASLGLEKASHVALKMILALEKAAGWSDVLLCLESLYACLRTPVLNINTV